MFIANLVRFAVVSAVCAVALAGCQKASLSESEPGYLIDNGESACFVKGKGGQAVEVPCDESSPQAAGWDWGDAQDPTADLDGSSKDALPGDPHGSLIWYDDELRACYTQGNDGEAVEVPCEGADL